MAQIYIIRGSGAITIEELTSAVASHCEIFDSVTYTNNKCTIKDSEGRIAATFDGTWFTFYDTEGSTIFTTSAYFSRAAVCKSGFIVYVSGSRSSVIGLTKSYNGEYAIIQPTNNCESCTTMSRSSFGSKQYSFGTGTEDLQTLLMFIPLAIGEHAYDCTRYAFVAMVWQSNTNEGIVDVNGTDYVQVGRLFMIDSLVQGG